MADAAVARETLFALRETIAKLEGKPAPALAATGPVGGQTDVAGRERLTVATGAADLDAAMQGGLPLDGLTEIRILGLRDAGAASGFALALAARCRMREETGTASAVLWITDAVSGLEAGYPYAVGLDDFGLEPDGFLHALPRRLDEALWIAEAALASAAFAVVILEIRGNPARFGLTENRRLALRAKAAGCPLLLLRLGGEEEASSASFRLCIEPAPASTRFLPDNSMLGGSIGNPVFRVVLEKSRNSSPLSFLLEWNAHDRQFYSAAVPVPGLEHPALSKARPAHSGPRLSASSDRSDHPQAMGAILAFDRAS